MKTFNALNIAVIGLLLGFRAEARTCEMPSDAAKVCGAVPGSPNGGPSPLDVILHSGDVVQGKRQAHKVTAGVFETKVQDKKIDGLVPLKGGLDFKTVPESKDVLTFDVDQTKKFQTMRGFGGNMTEACAINMMRLSAPKRKEVLTKMFSKTTGAGFDYLRLPMGSTDFGDGAKGSYSYDDSPNNEPDPEFKHFDMSRDEKTFELIREAKKINPELHVMISPWSAPAWMKPSGTLRGGYLDPDHYQDYANYFVRVIKEYEKRGMPVDGLTVQNEPGYDTAAYSSMYMSVADQQRFIGDYLGPALAKNGLSGIKIFGLDHSWSDSVAAVALVDQPKVSSFVGGVAYHCYWGFKENMYDTYNQDHDREILQNECTGADSGLDGKASDPVGDFQWWMENQSVGAVSMGPTGESGALGWNLCLDEKNGPINGITDKSKLDHGSPVSTGVRGMVKIDFSKGGGGNPEVIYNGEFHALAQVSRFIHPGAVRIDAGQDSKAVETAAFQNPDHSIVFVAHNTTGDPIKILVRNSACQSILYELAPGSATSFVWKE
ncbi:MAG: glycoside hydrolase family 30 protein [Bdellovibrionota bacterium]